MTTFQDIFKKSFLEGYAASGLTTKSIIFSLLLASAFALYIFIVYRSFTRKTFYSKSFNISLAALTVITAAVILTIQSSIVVSLGMVGALSIVRFLILLHHTLIHLGKLQFLCLISKYCNFICLLPCMFTLL